MDSRNRSAFDIVAELRRHPKALKLAVLGTHQVDAKALAEALPAAIFKAVGNPDFILTGCSDVGTEKAARLAAKQVTGRLAVVFHRAELTYGKKAAEQMRNVLLAQESTALLVVTGEKKVCRHARERFSARNRPIYDIEIG